MYLTLTLLFDNINVRIQTIIKIARTMLIVQCLSATDKEYYVCFTWYFFIPHIYFVICVWIIFSLVEFSTTDKMDPIPLLFLIFIIFMMSTIQLNDAKNCSIQYPFQWNTNQQKCHPYDYCLTFDDSRWQTIQFSTKNAYRLKKKSTTQNHFDLESEYKTDSIWLEFWNCN